MLVESSSAGDVYYVYGHGLISEHRGSDVNTYHFDYRGSTVAMTDASGSVKGTASYDEYGVKLSNTLATRFTYNGQFGVEDDGTGMYYMRTRYYNVDLKRFMNRDVVIGSSHSAQSLNRYAYVNGNPISYTDPFGMARETLEQTQGLAGFDIHLLLDVAGMIPVIGEFADATNAVLYLSKGQYVDATVSASAMIPIVGNLGTGARSTSKVVGKLDHRKAEYIKKLRDDKGYKNPNKVIKSEKNKARKLLDSEGDIGTYSYLNKKGHKGDDVTPHHMPSKEFLIRNMDMDRKDALNNGLSMNLQQMVKGGIHRKTKTYGRNMSNKEKEFYYSLSNRDAIAYDLKDLKRLAIEEGTYDQYRPYIKEYIKRSIEFYDL